MWHQSFCETGAIRCGDQYITISIFVPKYTSVREHPFGHRVHQSRLNFNILQCNDHGIEESYTNNIVIGKMDGGSFLHDKV